MDSKYIHICEKCRNELKSPTLCLLWEGFCEEYIETGKWISFTEVLIRKNYEIRNIELKGYVTSIDHENKIFLKPQGIFECDYDTIDAFFIVCMNIEDHFNYAFYKD